MKIRRDERGLYIQGRLGKFSGPEDKYRPGPVAGHSHVYDMSDGGLKEDDNPKTKHVNGAPFIQITLENGHKLHWATTYVLDAKGEFLKFLSQ